MFDLEKEVAAWSESVHAERCSDGASVAELSDHLHCEIDRARAEGFSTERAFSVAVTKLGQARDLTAEHAKNRSRLGTLFARVMRCERRSSGGDQRGLLIAHSILWGSLILASSMVMSRTDAPEAFEWLLLVVFVPVWWCSEQILRRALRQRPKDGPR